uniref:Zinc finger and BTB domain-containing protein 49 n=1 Tax=Zeugodacus cucurbitae TaxID=28588 RepID=A0A0A1WQ63_ZEUCU
MSVVSTLLAQQVYNWQLEDFACFRKCGEITVSPDAQTYGMNCRFCPGICLQFDVFIEHIREVHAERVSGLYQQTDVCGEGNCEQSTQTQTQTELLVEGSYSDYDDAAAFIAAIANHTADGDGDDDDFDIDVERIDGDECNYNNAATVSANVGSDTDTDSAANTAQTTLPAPRRYPQRLRRRCTAVLNGINEDKPPRKLCNWNEAPSAKYTVSLDKFKTLTNTHTPPTPAPTPSPWTTPLQNVKEGGGGGGSTVANAVENENESETKATTKAMDTPDDTRLDMSLGAQIVDMSDLMCDGDGDVEMQAHSEPEAPQEQVDLVYIMESATPDGIIEEETVVDPFEMTQGWRRSTDSSECPENDVPSPYNNEELRKNLIELPLSRLKTQNCEKPLVNENEHSTEVIFYLLEAYKKNEKLWNPNHPQYKYNANRKMFEELSRPLLRDMNYSLDGSEIYAIIKSLRSRYRLELAKARERKGKYKTRFKYFEKMEFLRDIIENKRAARRVKKQLDSSVTDKSLDEDCTESTRSIHNRTVLTYLLDAFRSEEALWNPQHPDYLLCNKNELMREISIKLLLEKDVTMTADECATEIQKLRTRYRRELRIVHEQKGLYAPKLWCFEQMEFLQKIFEDQLCDRLKKRKGVIACKPKIQYLKAKSIGFKSNDDHLTFIEIYKSYSALWDVDHPDYRSTTYRNEELNQMLEEVNLMLGIDSTLEELQKTLYEMRKEFSAEKHKRLVEVTQQTDTTQPPPPQSIIQTKLMEFLDLNLGPFRCDVCAELIKTSDQYKIHKSGHDGMQPFICTLCGKGFQIPGNLTIHIRRHKGDFPYACEVCDKKFATSTEVAIHMRSHTGERPYICDYCGKSFKTWSFYDTHRRAHLNQSNFHCPICDKAFYERNRYTDHMNGHLNIRKHVCDVCGKAYTTFANLKKHTELHLPVKKYKCDICGQRFAQFASVRWHKRKTHAQTHDKRHEQMEQ